MSSINGSISSVFEQEGSYHWCCKSRGLRNAWRVSIAGGLSAMGAMIAGYVAPPHGTAVGAMISGIANGLSTWFMWEVAPDLRIAALERRYKDLAIRVGATALPALEIVIA